MSISMRSEQHTAMLPAMPFLACIHRQRCWRGGMSRASGCRGVLRSSAF